MPGFDVANVERLQRMFDDDALADLVRRGHVEGVEQFVQRHRGRARLARVLIGAGVGDDQLLGGRADGVEQQLPVLGTDVAFTGHRVAGQHVVAVDDAEAREHAVVEADQADHPVRHRAHRHHRAHRQRAGAEVGPGRATGQVPVEQCADIGQPQNGVGARTGLLQHFSELALHLAGLPGVGIVDARQHGDAVGQRVQPLLQRPRAGEGVDHRLEPADEFGELAGQFDAVAADVVQRQGVADPGVRVIGHRDAGQYPVDTETPRVVHEVNVIRPAMLLIEAPPDVRLPDPAGDRLQVVIGEAEPGTHRRGLGDVEHLAGRDPAAGQRQQLRGQAEQRIGLDQRTVGELDPQPVGGMRAVHHVAEPEVGDDQRRIRLDVRAHHQDVARLQRRVVLQQAEQHLAQHIDLTGRAVAAVHLHGAVICR